MTIFPMLPRQTLKLHSQIESQTKLLAERNYKKLVDAPVTVGTQFHYVVNVPDG